MLLTIGIAANNYSMVGFRGALETAGEREQFQSGELAAIIGDNKTAWPGNGPESVDDAGMGYGDDIPGFENNIARSVARLEDTRQIDGNRVCDGWRNRVWNRSGVRGR